MSGAIPGGRLDSVRVVRQGRDRAFRARASRANPPLRANLAVRQVRAAVQHACAVRATIAEAISACIELRADLARSLLPDRGRVHACGGQNRIRRGCSPHCQAVGLGSCFPKHDSATRCCVSQACIVHAAGNACARCLAVGSLHSARRRKGSRATRRVSAIPSTGRVSGAVITKVGTSAADGDTGGGHACRKRARRGDSCGFGACFRHGGVGSLSIWADFARFSIVAGVARNTLDAS